MAFTALEVKIKAEVKDLKKGLAQARKEVAKFKSDLDKVSGPLDKMAKSFSDNSKLALKLANIGAKRTKVIENNLKLSLEQVKATEKQLQLAGKLDSKTQKSLNKRASLLTKIAAKEISTLEKAKVALKAKNDLSKQASKDAERIARANLKALEIDKNIAVIADKNRVLALKKANIGATAVEKIKNQLKFDLKSLDIQRDKLQAAKRINRETITGLNKQKALLSAMASKKISVIDGGNLQKATGLLGRLKDSFGKVSVSIIAFNQALELMAKAVRAFRFVFNATIQPFADFETALVGVSKTTTLSGQALDIFGKQIEQLSGQIPASNEELLKVAETAGQLGVDGRKNLLNFADTLTRVAVSTNLTAEQAATDFTKILNVTRTPIDKIDEFSSVVVALGNNFATNEQKITRMTNEVARATTAFDVAAQDTAAFATAMSAMGIRAEIGGSVLARSMVRIEEAIIGGGQKFKVLQKIMDQTGDQIKKTFSTDATKATRQFINGLDRLRKQGVPTISILDQFGLKGDEVNKVIPPLVKNVDELNRAFALARKEFGNATALMKESDKQFNTLNSRMKVLSNTFDTLGTEIGSIFAPAVTAVTNTLANLAKGLTVIARTINHLAGVFKILLTDLKIFTPVLGLVGITFLVVAGKASVLTTALGFVLIAFRAVFAAMAKFVIATAPVTLAVVGIVAALVGLAATIELVLLNFLKLKVLASFVAIVFKQVVAEAQKGMLELGLAINNGLLAIAKVAGSEKLIERFGGRAADKVDRINKKVRETNVLAEKQRQLAKQLDFGTSGKAVNAISDMFKDLNEFPDLFKDIDRSGGKVARIYERQAAALKDQSKTLTNLAKILKENRKIQSDINKLRGGGTDPIIEQLRLDLSNVEARKQLVIQQQKLNDKMGDQSKIVDALTKQQDLLRERAAAALDAAIPDRILKRLSVDVVFGSFDGFLQGLEQTFAIFDEATAGYFTILPRALIEGVSKAGEALGDMFGEPLSQAFSSASDFLTSAGEGISELFSRNVDEFNEAFGVNLKEAFGDAADMISDAFESSVGFFEDLFSDDPLNFETAKALEGAQVAGAAIGPGIDAVKDIQPQLTADQNLSLAASELSLAAAALEEAAAAAGGAGGAALPGAAGAAGAALPGAAPGALAAAAPAAGAAGAAAAAGGGLAAFEGMIDAIQALIDFLPRILDKIANIFTSLTELPQKILEGVTKVFDAAIKFITDFIPNLLQIIPKILIEFTKFLKNLPKAVLLLLKEIPVLIMELIQELPTIIEELVTELIAAAPDIAIAIMDTLINEAPQLGIEIGKFFLIGLPLAIVNGIIEGLKRVAKSIMNLLTNNVDFGELIDMGMKAVDAVGRAVTGVGTQLFQVAELGAVEKAEKAAKATGEAIRKAGSDVLDKLREAWLWVFGKLSELWEIIKGIWASVWAAAEAIWHQLEMIWKNVWIAFNKFLSDLFTAISKAITDIVNAFTKAIGDIINYFTKDLPNDIMNAFDFLFDLFSAETMKKAFAPIGDLLSVEKIKEVFNKVFSALDISSLLGKAFSLDGAFSGNPGTVEQLLGINVPFVNFAEGGAVPGNAAVAGNSLANDKVPALLSPDEFVVPRSVTQDPQARALLDALMKGSGVSMMAEGGIPTSVGDLKEGLSGAVSGAPSLPSMKDLERLGDQGAKSVIGFLEDPANGIGDLINAGGDVLKTGIQSAFESIGMILKDPLALVRTAVGKGGKKMIRQTLSRQGLQEGGVISGFGGGDRLPFNLEAGEGVLNKQAVKRMGVGAINRLNQGGSPGETVVNLEMTVNTTQAIDTAFIKNRIMPVMRDELKRSSSDGSFVMSRKGLR